MRRWSAEKGALLPSLALLFNGLVWGLSWWPLRYLESQGLHPLWATSFMFALATLAMSSAQPQAWRELLGSRGLWGVMLAAGCTNAAFNWAVATGDVVRVVLLFYLMPLWTALLARWLLAERLTAIVVFRLMLAIAGAVLVLAPPSGADSHWAGSVSMVDGLGVVGGFFFALNNVLLRREVECSGTSRALAMFVGAGLVAGLCGVVLAHAGHVPVVPPLESSWLAPTAALSVVFLMANFALQFGSARLPANVAALFMLSEVVFATLSAVWIGNASLHAQTLWGGGLILLVAVLAITHQPFSRDHHDHAP